MTDKINPLLLDIPGELMTERLRLRTPRAGDGGMVCLSVRESLAELKPWMPWATDSYDAAAGEEWCRKCAAQFLAREQFQFILLTREGGEHVGSAGIFNLRWDVPRCEIGYWLRTRFTGRGLMAEAVRELTRLALETLQARRIEIHTDDRNVKSWRVAERCGYALEGVLRCESRSPDGSLRDTRVYARVAPG